MLEHLPAGNISLRAQDIQTGLQEYSVSEFKSLTEIGWAARIAIHLRSSGPVESHRLQFVAEHLFGVNKWAFSQVLGLLQRANLVRVIGSGDEATVVPQSIPYFNGLYERLDEIAADAGLNEHEQLSVDLLHRLSVSPAPKNRILHDTGAETEVLDRVLSIGSSGSYLGQVKVAGSEILVSPLYFSENAPQFANIVAKHGEADVKRVISLLRTYAGWPLSHILKGRIGPETLTPTELEVARSITSRALTQPPSITARGATNFFVFTPMIGTAQIEVIEKEIYERAIAIVAAIRHGQHFAFWEIKYPTTLLRRLMERPISPPAEAKDQYRDLRSARSCDSIHHRPSRSRVSCLLITRRTARRSHWRSRCSWGTRDRCEAQVRRPRSCWPRRQHTTSFFGDSERYDRNASFRKQRMKSRRTSTNFLSIA